MKPRTATQLMSGRLLERFSEIVDAIYEAALEPRSWQRVLPLLAEFHSSPKVLFLTPYDIPSLGGFVFAHGFTEAQIQLWATTFSQHDVMAKAAHAKGFVRNGEVTLNEDFITEEELENSFYYKEFLSKVDIWHVLAGVVLDGRADDRAPTVCNVIRGRAAPPFTELDRQIHKLTIRHVSRAVGTMLRIRDTEFRLACSEAALDRLGCGILLFGSKGNVIFMNRSAEAVIRAADGLTVRAGDPTSDSLGWIVAERTDENAVLRQEIKDAVDRNALSAAHFSEGVVITRPSGKRPYLVQVCALARANDFSAGARGACAIGFVSDLEHRPQLDRELVARLYALTPAEIELAQHILTGDPVEAIATRAGVKPTTIRTQLQSLFEKTGTHRQPELMRLLVGLAVTPRNPPFR